MLCGGKTAADGDLVQRQLAAKQQLMHLCQADVVQVFQKGGPGGAVEYAAEMIAAHMHSLRRLLQSDGLAVMAVDEADGGDNLIRNVLCG